MGRRAVGMGRGRLFFVAALAMLIGLFGATGAGAQDADDPALVDEGRTVFNSSCAGCHGDEGQGSDTGRPLIGIAAQQPDRSVHIASVTDGKGGMPALGEALTDEEINAAVTYVRLTFVEANLSQLPNTGSSRLPLALGSSLLAAGLGLTFFSARRDEEIA